jgi:hypothetical protein
MAGAAHVEAVAGEQPERTGQALLRNSRSASTVACCGGSCQRNTVWPSRGSE